MLRIKAGNRYVDVPRVVEAGHGVRVQDYVDAVVDSEDGRTLVGVPFASSQAKSRAEAAGLDAWDLERRRPSGTTGFTLKDVEDVLRVRGALQEPQEGAQDAPTPEED